MILKHLVIGVAIIACTSTADLDSDRAARDSQVWTWSCDSAKGCKKQLREDAPELPVWSLEVCQMMCHKGNLWPKPSGTLNLTEDLTRVNPNSIYLKVQVENDSGKRAEKLANDAGKLFTSTVSQPGKGKISGGGKNLVVNLVIRDGSQTTFTEGADESYKLVSKLNKDGSVNVTITGEAFFGVRHGLETLSQLIVYDVNTRSLVMPSIILIEDRPVYTHRGIALDTSRNFISVPLLKKTLDAMAYNKLNTFHWHITDSHSFPMTSKTFPELTKYGAYSPDKVYSESDIKSLVKYARLRGIRIIPEFDAPAHVGSGWQNWTGDALVCFGAEPWSQYCVEPPCGQLNPTSEKTYEILDGIYKDMEDLFDSDVFHMGGDEVNINCWNSTESIVQNMSKMGLGQTKDDFHKLWSIFQDRALQLFQKNSDEKKPIILWTSTLTEEGQVDKYLDKDRYIIQIWTLGNDNVIAELVNKGFKVILSNYDALYFDCGFGAWVGEGNNWCSPYIPWQKVYQNDPKQILRDLNVTSDDALKLVLGSEAALWTEQADDSSIENRLWPRGAALAEALWTGPGAWKEAEQRFLGQRERMADRRLKPDTIQPEWCVQNQGACYL